MAVCLHLGGWGGSGVYVQWGRAEEASTEGAMLCFKVAVSAV